MPSLTDMDEAGAGARPLRLVIALGAMRVHAWIAELVRDLETSPRFDVHLALVPPPPPVPHSPLLVMYERVDAALFRQARDALEYITLTGPTPVSGEIGACDVVLALAPVDSNAPAPKARFGVWEVRHTDVHGRRSEPLLFRESAARDVVATRVEAILPRGERRLAYVSYGATDEASLHRGRNRALWKAKAAMLNALRALDARRGAYLASLPPDRAHADAPPPRVRGREVVAFAARAAGGLARRRVRSLVYDEQWFIAARPHVPGRMLEPSGAETAFVRIDPPPGRAFADPFPMDEDDRTYTFFEDYGVRERRAHISYVVLDHSGRAITPPAPALQADFHLSYPFVFRRNGTIFMIPESSADRAVSLYRAADFPSQWVRERTLLADIDAVDATLLDHGDRLWLFVGVGAPGASLDDDLHLFSATDLEGPWEPHPGNPVVSDVRRARPAGRIFRHGDQLIRPGQDCSRTYGRAIVLNRIDVVSPGEYRETPFASIEPTWDAALTATHTYTFTEALEVVDGRRPTRRPLRGGVSRFVRVGHVVGSRPGRP